MEILLVEDEDGLREGLIDLLTAAGHSVDAVADGLEAVELSYTAQHDLVILDLMLPGLDGIEVCRRARAARPGLPILMLTARGSEQDKVAGLESGADDYVTKPFGAKELLARVDALARRARAVPRDPDLLEIDGCVIDLGRHQAQRDQTVIQLTPREVGIIRWLHRHRARAVSRAELLEHVWTASSTMQTRTVDMTVAKLRQKIELDAAEPRIVVTVTGVGYAWGTAWSPP